MTCEHRSSNRDGTITCAALRTLGVTSAAGPGNPNYPCPTCRAQWLGNGPPDPADRATWPPKLLEFVFSGEPTAARVPCYHLGELLAHACCNRKRVYACDNPTASGKSRVTVTDCAACPAYDPDG